MSQGTVSNKLVARRLAVLVADAIDESGKSTVLVTSTAPGAGKSLLIRMIEPELERIAPNRFRVVGTAELAEMDPWAPPDDRVLLVDGPAVLLEDGFMGLRRGWVSAFDGALVLVVGRETRSDELLETAAWLRAAKIPIIGLIWNERVAPPLQFRIRLVIDKLNELLNRRKSRSAALPSPDPSPLSRQGEP